MRKVALNRNGLQVRWLPDRNTPQGFQHINPPHPLSQTYSASMGHVLITDYSTRYGSRPAVLLVV